MTNARQALRERKVKNCQTSKNALNYKDLPSLRCMASGQDQLFEKRDREGAGMGP